MSQVNRLEVAFSVEDLGDRFKQVDTSLSVQLDGCGLAPAVNEAERYRGGLTIQDGLVNGHASLLILVEDSECKVLDVVLLSS